MGKLMIIFYTFVSVVLVLFACFTYLMTTVNPAAAETTKATRTTTTEAPAPPPDPPGRMKLLDYNESGRFKTRVTMTQQPKADDLAGLIENYPKTINDTYAKKRKGRRSVNQRRKKNPGIVVMKVVDSDGRPRIEIVFYPKQPSNDWKMYRKNTVVDFKRPEIDLLRDSIINIMPDDSIVFENKVISQKRELGPDYIILADVSDKTEDTKEVLDVKNLDSKIKTPNNNENETKMNTVLLSQPYPAKGTSTENTDANSSTDMNTYFIEDVQTISYIDISVENTDNLLDTSTENPNANDSTQMKTDFSEDVQTISYKDVSVDNLILHYTDPSGNISIGNKKYTRINKNGSSKYVHDTQDLGTILTTTSNINTAVWNTADIINKTETDLGSFINTSNHNEGGTGQNTVLPSQFLPSIERTHSNDNTEMKTDFSTEAQTLSKEETSLENTDNYIHSTSPSFNTTIGNTEDIGINKNESSKDVLDTKDLETIVTTTSDLNESVTKPNTILMSYAEETSTIELSQENYTMKIEMDLNEETIRVPISTTES